MWIPGLAELVTPVYRSGEAQGHQIGTQGHPTWAATGGWDQRGLRVSRPITEASLPTRKNAGWRAQQMKSRPDVPGIPDIPGGQPSLRPQLQASDLWAQKLHPGNFGKLLWRKKKKIALSVLGHCALRSKNPARGAAQVQGLTELE